MKLLSQAEVINEGFTKNGNHFIKGSQRYLRCPNCFKFNLVKKFPNMNNILEYNCVWCNAGNKIKLKSGGIEK